MKFRNVWLGLWLRSTAGQGHRPNISPVRASSCSKRRPFRLNGCSSSMLLANQISSTPSPSRSNGKNGVNQMPGITPAPSSFFHISVPSSAKTMIFMRWRGKKNISTYGSISASSQYATKIARLSPRFTGTARHWPRLEAIFISNTGRRSKEAAASTATLVQSNTRNQTVRVSIDRCGIAIVFLHQDRVSIGDTNLDRRATSLRTVFRG